MKKVDRPVDSIGKGVKNAASRSLLNPEESWPLVASPSPSGFNCSDRNREKVCEGALYYCWNF